MTPEERQAWRWAYAKDLAVQRVRLQMEKDALVAECSLAVQVVGPELVAELQRIGEAAK